MAGEIGAREMQCTICTATLVLQQLGAQWLSAAVEN